MKLPVKIIDNLTPEERAAREEKRRIEAEERKIKAEEDARLAVPREIEKFRADAADYTKRADNLSHLYESYPDLRRQEGRWKKIVYYTKSVNDKVNKYDLRHNCGCCNDSPLELWPYMETPHGNVYSDPPKFVIGEQHFVAGDKPYDGWKEQLREAKIPEAIVEAMIAHFKAGIEERKSYVDDHEP